MQQVAGSVQRRMCARVLHILVHCIFTPEGKNGLGQRLTKVQCNMCHTQLHVPLATFGQQVDSRPAGRVARACHQQPAASNDSLTVPQIGAATTFFFYMWHTCVKLLQPVLGQAAGRAHLIELTYSATCGKLQAPQAATTVKALRSGHKSNLLSCNTRTQLNELQISICIYACFHLPTACCLLPDAACMLCPVWHVAGVTIFVAPCKFRTQPPMERNKSQLNCSCISYFAY